ncbi:MAG TPA: hypothetical protein VK559_04840 [Ferruginibacter sp.]|nr:hypothetical protein [Ferruginibacter sp.]
MKRVKILSAVAIMAVAMLAALSMSSCKKSSSTAAKPTLYDSLGGTTLVTDPTDTTTKIEAGHLAIRSVLDSTIFVIAGDSRINSHFQVLLAEVSATPANYTGFNELLRNLTNFVSIGTGAKDYTYDGLSMTDAHNPATNSRMNGKATDADFDAFVDDLVTGANQNHVPANLIGSVGALVETLRSQVVQAP